MDRRTPNFRQYWQDRAMEYLIEHQAQQVARCFHLNSI